MKKSIHRFNKNSKSISFGQLSYKIYCKLRKEGMNKDDTHCLAFVDKKDKEQTVRLYLRPDEAILVAKLITEGIWKSIFKYGVNLK